MTLLPLLFAAAQAEPRHAATLAIAGEVADLAVSADGRWIAARVAGDKVAMTDTYTWDAVERVACEGGAAGPSSRSGGLAFTADSDLYVGCADGTVAILRWGSGGWEDSGEIVDFALGAVRGLVVVGDQLLAVVDPDAGEGNPLAMVYGITDGTLVSDAGTVVGQSGFADIEATSAVGVVAQGGDKIAKIDAATGSVSTSSQSVGGAAIDDLLYLSGNTFLAAGGGSGLLRYSAGDGEITTAANLTALGLSPGDSDVTSLGLLGDELVLADTYEQRLAAFPITVESGTVSTTESWTLGYPDASGAAEVVEMATIPGYLLAGVRSASDQAGLWVLTERPWVVTLPAVPSLAVQGDTVQISFTADMAGDWSLRRGATSNTDGAELGSGTMEAGETIDTEITIGAGFGEGGNLVRVVVDSNGKVGHDSVSIVIDNPPERPSFDVDFADSALRVKVNTSSMADVATVVLFVTTVPFEANDYADCADATEATNWCGPAPVDVPGVTAPITLTVEADKNLVHRVEGLTNNVKYYVAVRAIDAGGQEGAMSKVKVGTPRETYSVSELVGEDGGFCGTPAPLSALLAGAGALLVASRRRRALLPLVALGAGLMLPAPEAQAADGAMQIRLGRLDLADEVMDATLGEANKKVLWLEFAPKVPEVGKYLEPTLGLGLYRNHGFQFDSEFKPSFEPDKVGCFPFTAGVTGRLDVLHNQPIVPVVGVGADYWFFNERWSSEVGGNLNQSVSGGKYGWHYLIGGQILLDVLDPDRASVLEARSGIRNSYLAIEYRQQTIGEAQAEEEGGGFIFSGDAVTVGLKFDY